MHALMEVNRVGLSIIPGTDSEQWGRGGGVEPVSAWPSGAWSGSALGGSRDGIVLEFLRGLSGDGAAEFVTVTARDGTGERGRVDYREVLRKVGWVSTQLSSGASASALSSPKKLGQDPAYGLGSENGR